MESLDNRYHFYIVEDGNEGIPEFLRLDDFGFDFEPFTPRDRIEAHANAMFNELAQRHLPGRGQLMLLKETEIIAVEKRYPGPFVLEWVWA